MKRVKMNLSDVLRSKNMNQKTLAQLTGLREATISVIARNTTEKINYTHLTKIMEALEINDFNILLQLVDE